MLVFMVCLVVFVRDWFCLLVVFVFHFVCSGLFVLACVVSSLCARVFVCVCECVFVCFCACVCAC